MAATATAGRDARPSAGTRAASRRRRTVRPGAIALTAFTWLVVFLFFFPVLWMVFTSFKTEGAAATFPPQFITDLSLDRYRDVISNRGMSSYLINSTTAAVGSTIVVMLLAIPAAYGLSVRPLTRWSDLLFFFISTRFMPVAAGIIPIYILLQRGGLLDNINMLAFLYVGINLPIAIWMMRSFFAEIPREVVEAAQIDGAGYFRELVRVSLPMVSPGAAAAALITFIFAWNEYFLAQLLTSTLARTTPPFLGSLVDGRGQFLAVLCAGSTLAVLPVVIAGWVAQKRLVRGLAMGAIK